MDSFLYDDIENDQKNIRRLATIEGSINRTLLYDEEKIKHHVKIHTGS